MKVTAVVNDIHIPFHDKRAIDIFFAVLEDLHQTKCLSEIVLNGDIADFYGVKLYPKMPHDVGIKVSIKDEVYQVNKFLDLLQAKFEGVKITYIEGNHESRLLRYICAKAPDLFDMFTVPELFKLEERGIEFIPYGRGQRYKVENVDMMIKHSPYSYSKHCAMANIEKKFQSILFGCTHRRQEVIVRDGDDNEVIGIGNGCMIDFSSKIFNYMASDNWSQGFTLLYANTDIWFNKYVKITDGQAVFNNVHYVGREDFEF